MTARPVPREVGVDHGARETGRSKRRVAGGVPDALGHHPLLAVFASALTWAHRTEEIPNDHSALLPLVPERDLGICARVPYAADARTHLTVVSAGAQDRGEIRPKLLTRPRLPRSLTAASSSRMVAISSGGLRAVSLRRIRATRVPPQSPFRISPRDARRGLRAANPVPRGNLNLVEMSTRCAAGRRGTTRRLRSSQ